MAQNTYLFISEVCQNREQILSGLTDVKYETIKEDYKKIIHQNFQIIEPKCLLSNPDDWQEHLKKLADFQLQVKIIFFSIRYERLDVMSFRLNNLMKYFKSNANNICLIITDFHKSQNKISDFQYLYRTLAMKFGIQLLYGYYKIEDKDTFYQFRPSRTTNNTKNIKITDNTNNNDKEIEGANQFFQEVSFSKKKNITLDGNEMGVYPQIDHQLLSLLKIRFKSADPRLNIKSEIRKKILIKEPPQIVLLEKPVTQKACSSGVQQNTLRK